MKKDLNEISDGKIYKLNDMVRTAKGGCEGCHACCEKMGASILLDPLDIYQLTKNRNMDFSALLEESIELNIADGLILPNIRMAGERECCVYLNQEGRCSIHGYRPGICRVFPLGRVYEENRLDYFLQKDACQKESGIKIKVSKCLDVPEQKKNQQFLLDWHQFKKLLQEAVSGMTDETAVRTLNLFVLKTFYREPYDGNMDFYQQFYGRLNQAKQVLYLDDLEQ